ncbi:hypothetical protein [Solitalea canadensis]|uniref:Carbohydrate-binding domain-containing protein n=1 Tax=Solitalea canadensis (strain ATCC 29591 / DSM 3403 / JCM 21819 / LMG 8368 / NBRC 15130 / NCIMB 12057 / USAM 9D) TaxID=929556 RepID=H8KWE8_SOLCM|nr:hypothetical protein [Solitalea canadensis]AFD07940.1 hypothetical protein Solca_2918 [Solitalea canadensis DSM 3403]
MKKIVFPLLVALSLSSVEAFAQKTFKCAFRTKPVVADGLLNDWSYAIDDENVDRSGHLKYAIANDKENLYIALRIFDKTTQAKVFFGGMKMILDTAAKKQENTAIEFPIVAKLKPGEKPRWDFKSGERTGIKDLHKKAKEENKEMNLAGFYAFANGKQNINDNSSGVKVGFDWDEDDALIYEVIIPFNTFYASAFKSKKNELTVGLRINGIDKALLPEKQFTMMRPQNRRGGNAGSYGGVQGGLPNPAADENEIFTEAIKYNLKLQLATH